MVFMGALISQKQLSPGSRGKKKYYEINETTHYLLQIKLVLLAAFPCLGFREFGDEKCRTVCMSGS